MNSARKRRAAPWPLAAGITVLISAWAPLHAQHGTPGGSVGDDHQKGADAGVPKEQLAERAKAQAQSEPLLQTLQISCSITNARLVVSGTRQTKPGTKEVDSRVYEVACSEGMGYLLQTQGNDTPLATSCLSTEEARAGDVAKGKPPGYFCALPENRDVYALVTSMITKGTGAPCTVAELQWFGRSAATHSDYSEVRCKEGTGFLLQVPQPGASTPSTAMTCTQAAQRGIKCHLTDGGPVEAPISEDILKAALAEHGVSCKIDQFRLIGQEEQRKRYVVEYRCADQPASAVAFIPLRGNTDAYETLDCVKAGEKGVRCAFSH